MIAPRKVKFEAKKKENENIEFRTFLKCNADEKELDEQFKNFMKSCLQIMTAADVGTVVRCTAEVFRKKIWRKMQNIWELRKKSL